MGIVLCVRLMANVCDSTRSSSTHLTNDWPNSPQRQKWTLSSFSCLNPAEVAAPTVLILSPRKRSSPADNSSKNQWLNLSITKYKKLQLLILPATTIPSSRQLFPFATLPWTLVSLLPITAHQWALATRNTHPNLVIVSPVCVALIRDVEDLLVKNKISVDHSG